MSHADDCRALAAQAATATLCTLSREPAGYPFGSLVAMAFDARGRPVLLLSALAEHTANLAADSRASILVHAPSAGDPLAAGRMTLLGPCARLPEAEAGPARALFLARHPEAAGYASFKDFALYRLEPVAVRYVGGFGRMSWVDSAEYAAAAPP
jgi:putative heme iron utilization protein